MPAALRGRPTIPALAIAAACLALGLAIPTAADPDLWGHLRFGLDLLRTGHLTSLDPYSFTQDRPWINHEWLSEAQMGVAYAAGGTAGLLGLKALLVGATLWTIWKGLSGIEFGWRMGICSLALVGMGRALGTLRPQLWSLLCFVVLCRVLAGDGRHRRWLPLIFVLWANVHGGWIVGLGVLGAWTAGTLLMRQRDAIVWVACLAACGIATIATPYGWDLWTFLLETVGLGRDVTEWQPLGTVPPAAWVAWAGGAIALVWLALGRDRDWSRVLVLGALAYLSLRVERVLPFFAAGAALFAARGLRQRWPVPTQPESVSQWLFAGALGVATILVLTLGVRTVRSPCIPVIGSWIPDRETGASLVHARPGRLVTWFDWGEYVIWHHGERLLVSSDGRRETVYSDARLAEHDEVLTGTAQGLARLAAWNPEYVWLPSQFREVRDWLLEGGYRIDVEGPASFIAVRRDLPMLAAEAPGALPWCFP